MIDISLSLAADQVKRDLIRGSATIVIDVLRASSVIITALANGASWVMPVASVEEARSFRDKNPDSILGGERDAVKLPGFDNGNSPFEYSREKVEGKGIILSTTNGTKALAQCGDANEVIIGAFINLNSVVEKIYSSENPIHILCAGTRGEFSLDDFLCAGGIISGISKKAEISSDDLGLLAKTYWENMPRGIHDALKESLHYNTLLARGFRRDLDYCLSLDTHTIVPMLDSEGLWLMA